MEITSHRHKYFADFLDTNNVSQKLHDLPNKHLLIDQKVADLYPSLQSSHLYLSAQYMNAQEKLKTLDTAFTIIEKLLTSGIKKDHNFVVVGGGITQDIGTLVASLIHRGLKWVFVPTTLLAQTDSCIGSKSSINSLNFKNQIGNFYPPHHVYIDLNFLQTLASDDIISGIGEILKVHVLDGKKSFECLKVDHKNLIPQPVVLKKFIERSLNIKKVFIQEDEFDERTRRFLNFGHTFGHALETASNYRIPHGIAVIMGTKMATLLSKEKLALDEAYAHSIVEVCDHFLNLVKNELKFDHTSFVDGLLKDKKNTGDSVNFILLNRNAEPCMHPMPVGSLKDLNKYL